MLSILHNSFLIISTFPGLTIIPIHCFHFHHRYAQSLQIVLCFFFFYPSQPHFRWNSSVLSETKGRNAGDWWGHSACNELTSYFTVQPLKGLVKITSGSAIFPMMCIFRSCTDHKWSAVTPVTEPARPLMGAGWSQSRGKIWCECIWPHTLTTESTRVTVYIVSFYQNRCFIPKRTYTYTHLIQTEFFFSSRLERYTPSSDTDWQNLFLFFLNKPLQRLGGCRPLTGRSLNGLLSWSGARGGDRSQRDGQLQSLLSRSGWLWWRKAAVMMASSPPPNHRFTLSSPNPPPPPVPVR